MEFHLKSIPTQYGLSRGQVIEIITLNNITKIMSNFFSGFAAFIHY